MKDKKIRVLIVEDTLVARNLLQALVLSDDQFELAGIAENGKEACELSEKLTPDVVSMDILMPIMDGVEATRNIMQNHPVPIIIVSSFYQSSEIEMAMRVLEAGAVAILPRPWGPGHPKYLQSSRKYLNMLRLMSDVKVVRRKKEVGSKTVQNSEKAVLLSSWQLPRQEFKALAIGASAGGPEALVTILSGLREGFPLPVFIVQHIDSHFADGFAAWLNTCSKMRVTIAVNGEEIVPGHVYLAPGDQHLTVNANGTLSIAREPSTRGLRPSVDVLFKSIAQTYGKDSIAVILSGMGRDGVMELKHLYDLGAFTIAQEKMSCLVYGMPGEAVSKGAVCKILTPQDIVEVINKSVVFKNSLV